MRRLLILLLFLPLLGMAQPNIDYSGGNFTVSTILKQAGTYHAYGGFQDSAVTLTLTNQNTWYQITNATNNLWTGLEADGMTLSGDTITITNTGDYFGTVSLTFSGINARDYQVIVYNITQDTYTYHIGATTTGATNFTNIVLPLYLEVTAGDRFVIKLQCTSAAGATPVMKSAVFTIQYLHD
jgi:hypothetical protein